MYRTRYELSIASETEMENGEGQVSTISHSSDAGPYDRAQLILLYILPMVHQLYW